MVLICVGRQGGELQGSDSGIRVVFDLVTNKGTLRPKAGQHKACLN